MVKNFLQVRRPNKTADKATKIMQRGISNNMIPPQLRCDQAQRFRAEKISFFFCKSNYIKLLFAPVDDHRSIGGSRTLDPNTKMQVGDYANRQ